MRVFGRGVVLERKDEIELVLTDVVLPLFTGPEVADKILRERPHVKIMFMTGFSPDQICPLDTRSGLMP